MAPMKEAHVWTSDQPRSAQLCLVSPQRRQKTKQQLGGLSRTQPLRPQLSISLLPPHKSAKALAKNRAVQFRFLFC